MIKLTTVHIKVQQPGFQTTVQDLGRPGYAQFGVSASGAADRLSLRLGNLLVGNKPGSAALEMTLVGGTFEFEADAVIAITGSDFEPTINGKQAPMWSSLFIYAGDILRFGATKTGARCYCCIHGGVQVPRLLGSASTHIMTELGGWDGRALKKNDVLMYNKSELDSFVPVRLKNEILQSLSAREVLRVTYGPQMDWFTDEALDIFSSSAYRVAEEANRMGLRLTGGTLERKDSKDMLTEGVSLGAIQVPQDGQPIILFVEHQTTGGYPKIANVVSVDIHAIGQLRPRDEVRFKFVSIENALSLLSHQESLINPQSLIPYHG
ncbi:MAG: biotin-dependent carboxyltransferase family protein [Ignavibacteriales bacterium]|nr:biotin-dependent carboxyltransferase family protein [Ignavibacteriales bacterium]